MKPEVGNQSEQRVRRIAKWAIATVVVLAMLGGIILATLSGARFAPLPNPNGYDDFIHAGQSIVGEPYDYVSARNIVIEDFRAFISSNQPSLNLFQQGLSRQCSFPLQEAITNFGGTLPQLAEQKKLAQLLSAYGRFCELEKRTNEAAQANMQIIRYGDEISHRGFIINRLVGVACEAIGHSSLVKLLPSLNRTEAQLLLTNLISLEQNRITWAEIRRNENTFRNANLAKSFNPIQWVVAVWQSRQANQKARVRHNKALAHSRLIMTEVALRCYREDHGRAPVSLDALLPEYLKSIPDDPSNRKALVYLTQGTNWLIYSIGWDGKDDGGKPASRGFGTSGDILVDSPW